MGKIRLLVDARGIGGEGQGSVTYLKGMYNALINIAGEQYEIYMAGFSCKAIIAAFPKLSKRNFIQLKPGSSMKFYVFDFPKIIKAYQIDYAHFQYMVPFVKNAKFIVTTHDVLFNDFTDDFSLSYRMKRNYFFSQSLKKSNIRLTVSEYSKEAIHNHYGIDPNTIEVTPNAVDEKYLRPYDKQNAVNYITAKYDTRNYLLYVSRIEPRKNQAMLLNAYEKLELWKEGIELVFIGNDTLGSKCLEPHLETMEPEARKHVKWIKYVDDEDLLHFYQAAKMFIYSSKAEGFGIPPIEAGALKINTLCANVTAMRDFSFFEDNHFNPYDFENLCDLIQQNLYAPPTNSKLTSIANIIKHKFSWSQGALVLHNAIMRQTNGKEISFEQLEIKKMLEVF